MPSSGGVEHTKAPVGFPAGHLNVSVARGTGNGVTVRRSQARLRAMFETTIDLVMDLSSQPVDDPPWIERLYDLDIPLQFVAPAHDEISKKVATALAARAPQGRMDFLDTDLGEFMWLAQSQQAARVTTAFLRDPL